MKRARDVRDQLEGLMERVEIDITTSPQDATSIRKVRTMFKLLLGVSKTISGRIHYHYWECLKLF